MAGIMTRTAAKLNRRRRCVEMGSYAPLARSPISASLRAVSLALEHAIAALVEGADAFGEVFGFDDRGTRNREVGDGSLLPLRGVDPRIRARGADRDRRLLRDALGDL